jgi:hypothetical protein
MKSEETEGRAVEPEFVPPDTQLARTQGSTIEDLAQTEEGVDIIERGILIIKTLRAASIALTHPQDWVLFKAEDRITGYCQDAGCQRFSDLWGIEIVNLGTWERAEDPDTKDFSYSITADGISKRTGQTVTGITGVRYSTEDFITRRKLGRLQIDAEVRKAARANLHGSIVRELAGMKQVPEEELNSVWAQAQMTGKTSAKCNRGRGFGTQAQRLGADVQQSDDLKPGEEPFCQQCDPPTKMKFVPGGVSRDSQRPYDAFWACTVKDSKHKGLKHSDHMKGVEERRKAGAAAEAESKKGREPGAEG